MAQLHRILTRSFLNNGSLRSTLRRTMSSIEEDLDKPVKFSSSGAATWKAAYSRSGLPHPDESAWFQPYVVCGSVAAFLLYFCVLREENDIDEMLYVPLHERIEGLEEHQLRVVLEYNLQKGLPTSDIKKRLAEIENAKVQN